LPLSFAFSEVDDDDDDEAGLLALRAWRMHCVRHCGLRLSSHVHVSNHSFPPNTPVSEPDPADEPYPLPPPPLPPLLPPPRTPLLVFSADTPCCWAWARREGTAGTAKEGGVVATAAA
jgi:hypothetical protein